MAEHNENSAASGDDLEAAIPTRGIKPLYLALGAGVVFIGLVAWVLTGLIPETEPTKAKQAEAQAETSGMSKEEKKRHLAALKQGLAVHDQQQKAAAAKKKAEAERQQQAAAEREQKKAAAKGGTGKSPGSTPKQAGRAAQDLDQAAKEMEAAFE